MVFMEGGLPARMEIGVGRVQTGMAKILLNDMLFGFREK